MYVVANNDLKFEICKSRAGEYARRNGQIIQWVQCIDVAKDPVCKQKLDDLEEKSTGGAAAEKAKWMKRHDRDCGNLYGLLPLVKGMEMMLTDHLDRSEKALLRGSRCTIVGWSGSEVYKDSPTDIVLPKIPSVVYVKFENATWTIDGMTEPGIYPIVPVKNGWEFGKKGRWTLTLTLIPNPKTDPKTDTKRSYEETSRSDTTTISISTCIRYDSSCNSGYDIASCSCEHLFFSIGIRSTRIHCNVTCTKASRYYYHAILSKRTVPTRNTDS